MIKLTKKQEEVYESLMWLFDVHAGRYLGTGRTFLFARICVDLALQNPGRPIYLMDVTSFPMCGNNFIIEECFIKTIEILIKDSGLENFKLDKKKKILIYNTK